MNTIDDLISFGVSGPTAERMLSGYKNHIGETHGCNKVTDINYIGNGERDIELTCTLCGAKYHKIFRGSSNKWNELRKTCSCQYSTAEATPKPGVIRNDDPSYIGKVFGDYRVVSAFVDVRPGKSGGIVMWMCECVHCGDVVKKQPANVKHGAYCDCQHDARQEAFWSREIGRKYGRLTVVKIEHVRSGKNKKAYAVCNCECGGGLTTQFGNLQRGITKSCGCLEEEFIAKAKGGRKEARSRSPLYGTWSGMKSRCFNENNKAYKHYGGRGITVCDEWLGPEGFDRFEKWSYENGYKPESGLSLDRIDVNGNYEPENCRYATVFVQTVNQRKPKRRKAKTYDIDGVSKTMKQWCDCYGISTVAVKYRMETLGMDIKTALTTPKTRKGNVFAGEQARERAGVINKCESYIEANLYLAFIRTTSKYTLMPQYAIDRYRADFIVDGTDVVIECDGYDFHKSKEQIADDNERERAFVKMGYRVVRFSGSEINKDPEACCREIIEIVDALYRKDYSADAV